MLNAAALKKRFAQAMAEASPKVTQAAIAEACEVSAQAVTAWKQTGQIDPKHFPTLSQIFGKPLEFWYGTAAPTSVRESAPISYLPSQAAGRGDLILDLAGDIADDIAESEGIERGSRDFMRMHGRIVQRLQKALESQIPDNRLDFAAKLAARSQVEEKSDAERGSEEEVGAGSGRGHQGAAARKPAGRGKRK